MTRKEIEKAKKALPKIVSGKITVYTPEEKKLRNEISCREMINSILCYYGEKDIEDNYYLKKHILDIGIVRVRELIEEQKTDFRKAEVRNVADGYRAIIWADEM